MAYDDDKHIKSEERYNNIDLIDRGQANFYESKNDRIATSHRTSYDKVKKDFDDLGFELVSDKHKDSKEKLKFICKSHREKGIQEITYDDVHQKLRKGVLGCKYCARERMKLTPIKKAQANKLDGIGISHVEYVDLVKKVNPDIEISGRYNSSTSISFICTVDGYRGKENCNTLLKSYKCPICEFGHENVIEGKNDIASQNPVLASMFKNKDELLKYTINSRCKVDLICPCCGAILKGKAIDKANRRGVKCKCMSGGASMPERYVHQVLVQVTNGFETEKYLNGDLNYRYDFYDMNNGKPWIIEVMGKQHSEKTFETCGGRTLIQEKENDLNKRRYAIDAGISPENYITIDGREPGFKKMKDSILNSGISNIYDLSKVDWIAAYKKSLASRMIQVIELWNMGYKIKEMCSLLNINKSTVRRYLINGSSIELCNYDPGKSNRIKVVCLNTKEIFNSCRDAERKYNIHKGYVSGQIMGGNLTAGVLNGEKLRWAKYEELDK